MNFCSALVIPMSREQRISKFGVLDTEIFRKEWGNVASYRLTQYVVGFISDIKENKNLHELLYLVLLAGNYLNAVSICYIQGTSSLL